MYRVVKWCLMIVVYVVYALSDFVERHIEQETFGGTDACNEVISLSKEVGWKNIVEYTLDQNKRQNLSLCGDLTDNQNCCPVEKVLITYVNEHFYHSSLEKLKNVSTVFALSYKLFNFSFLNLLNHSKFELHRYLISANEQPFDEYNFFADLFWDLEEYFTGQTSPNLSDSFLTFFDNLIRQLFSFHFNDFNLEESSIDCISQLSKEIKPFGDVPITLGIQIKKSFQLVRVFSQALRQGQEILNILEKVLTPILPCPISVESMSYCSYCPELDLDLDVRCSNVSCINLIRNYCLKGLDQFEKEWLIYIDGLSSFVGCFDQYCNVEDVVGTIEENILKAITTFHLTAKQFFHEVSIKCDILPHGNREKRSLSALKQSPPILHPSNQLMEKLKNIRVDIESRRNFIASLVTDACLDLLLPSFSSQSQELNCSNILRRSHSSNNAHNTNEVDLNSKESQFAHLSQKVQNISERMKNILTSYKAFVSEKLEATSSGWGTYPSGSGEESDDDGGGDDDDGNDDGNVIDDKLFEENIKVVQKFGDGISESGRNRGTRAPDWIIEPLLFCIFIFKRFSIVLY